MSNLVPFRLPLIAKRCAGDEFDIRDMVTKYSQYEVLNFADKLHILSVSDNAEYTQKTYE